MRINRRRGGMVRLRLERYEAMVLGTALDELIRTLGDDVLDGDDPVRRRLYPDGYRDDSGAAGEFRELTETALRTERVERLRACRAALGEPGSAAVQLDIDPETAEVWLRALNDLRLALGTTIGITEDAAEPDPDRPDYEQWLLYHWLTAVQDSLVVARMG